MGYLDYTDYDYRQFVTKRVYGFKGFCRNKSSPSFLYRHFGYTFKVADFIEREKTNGTKLILDDQINAHGRAYWELCLYSADYKRGIVLRKYKIPGMRNYQKKLGRLRQRFLSDKRNIVSALEKMDFTVDAKTSIERTTIIRESPVDLVFGDI